MDRDETEELIGITRCARCGQRLENDLECPFCSLFPERPLRDSIPKWVFITACFLTSPLSLYAIIRTRRLSLIEKLLTFSGCIVWVLLYLFIRRQPWLM